MEINEIQNFIPFLLCYPHQSSVFFIFDIVNRIMLPKCNSGLNTALCQTSSAMPLFHTCTTESSQHKISTEFGEVQILIRL